jgi:hypothetical protein
MDSTKYVGYLENEIPTNFILFINRLLSLVALYCIFFRFAA